MTDLQFKQAFINSMIAANPDKAEQLNAIANNTANSALIDEQIEMLESCPKHEAMEAIERTNGISASEQYFN